MVSLTRHVSSSSVFLFWQHYDKDTNHARHKRSLHIGSSKMTNWLWELTKWQLGQWHISWSLAAWQWQCDSVTVTVWQCSVKHWRHCVTYWQHYCTVRCVIYWQIWHHRCTLCHILASPVHCVTYWHLLYIVSRIGSDVCRVVSHCVTHRLSYSQGQAVYWNPTQGRYTAAFVSNELSLHLLPVSLHCTALNSNLVFCLL